MPAVGQVVKFCHLRNKAEYNGQRASPRPMVGAHGDHTLAVQPRNIVPLATGGCHAALEVWRSRSPETSPCRRSRTGLPIGPTRRRSSARRGDGSTRTSSASRIRRRPSRTSRCTTSRRSRQLRQSHRQPYCARHAVVQAGRRDAAVGPGLPRQPGHRLLSDENGGSVEPLARAAWADWHDVLHGGDWIFLPRRAG